MNDYNLEKMNRNTLWKICWLISIFYALSIFLIPVIYIYHADDYESRKQFGVFIREMSLTIPFKLMGLISFIFWIYSIVIWNKRKGTIVNLLLLLFLNIIYAPIYYMREVRKK